MVSGEYATIDSKTIWTSLEPPHYAAFWLEMQLVSNAGTNLICVKHEKTLHLSEARKDMKRVHSSGNVQSLQSARKGVRCFRVKCANWAQNQEKDTKRVEGMQPSPQ